MDKQSQTVRKKFQLAYLWVLVSVLILLMLGASCGPAPRSTYFSDAQAPALAVAGEPVIVSGRIVMEASSQAGSIVSATVLNEYLQHVSDCVLSVNPQEAPEQDGPSQLTSIPLDGSGQFHLQLTCYQIGKRYVRLLSNGVRPVSIFPSVDVIPALPVSVSLSSDSENPVSPVVGETLRFTTDIRDEYGNAVPSGSYVSVSLIQNSDSTDVSAGEGEAVCYDDLCEVFGYTEGVFRLFISVPEAGINAVSDPLSFTQ